MYVVCCRHNSVSIGITQEGGIHWGSFLFHGYFSPNLRPAVGAYFSLEGLFPSVNGVYVEGLGTHEFFSLFRFHPQSSFFAIFRPMGIRTHDFAASWLSRLPLGRRGDRKHNIVLLRNRSKFFGACHRPELLVTV